MRGTAPEVTEEVGVVAGHYARMRVTKGALAGGLWTGTVPPPLGRVGGEEGGDYDNQASSFMKVSGAAELGVV